MLNTMYRESNIQALMAGVKVNDIMANSAQEKFELPT